MSGRSFDEILFEEEFFPPEKEPLYILIRTAENDEVFGYTASNEFISAKKGNGITGEEKRFIKESDVRIISINFNNCGCDYFSQMRYDLAVDPNKETRVFATAFNDDDKGFVIKNESDNPENKHKGISAEFFLGNGVSSEVKNDQHGWRQIDSQMLEKRNFVYDNEGNITSLEVQIYIIDNTVNKLTDKTTEGSRGGIVTLLYPVDQSSTKDNPVFKKAPTKFDMVAFRDDNDNVIEMSFLPELKKGCLVAKDKSEEYQSYLTGNYRRVAVGNLRDKEVMSEYEGVPVAEPIVFHPESETNRGKGKNIIRAISDFFDMGGSEAPTPARPSKSGNIKW